MSEYPLQPSHSIGIPISAVAAARTEQDEEKLVSASQAGDQDAFAQLVQHHQRRVFNLVYRMVQDYEEANEVTQDTFLAAWQGLSSFRGDARFSTWLYRIAYNCSLKQLEVHKRDRTIQAELQAEHILKVDSIDEQANAALDA